MPQEKMPQESAVQLNAKSPLSQWQDASSGQKRNRRGNHPKLPIYQEHLEHQQSQKLILMVRSNQKSQGEAKNQKTQCRQTKRETCT